MSNNEGIPPRLLQKLRETLSRCGPFESNEALKRVFKDARIIPWRDKLPEADDKQERIEALIDALYEQSRSDGGQNALALFVQVIGENTPRGDNCRDQLLELARQVQDSLGIQDASLVFLGSQGGSVSGVESTPDLEFSNRYDLLTILTSTNAGPYHLLDAPAQYGKSKLLEHVQKEWEQKGWLCARTRLCIQDVHTLQGLVRSLLTQFNVPPEDQVEILATPDFRRAGQQVGEWLKSDLDRKLLDDPGFRAGVLLLFDIDGMLADDLRVSLIEPLLNEFILAMENALSMSELGQKGLMSHILRVHIAGRYIKWVKDFNKELPWTHHLLSPFSYKHVLEATRKYLGDGASDPEMVAAHLMYYTAGHPGCMAQILRDFKSSGEECATFFQYQDSIWAIVDRAAHSVRQNIRLEMRVYMDELSIFRYLDHDILSLWMKASTGRELPHTDAYALAEALQDTQLMHYSSDNLSLLKDSIARGLLARYLLAERGDEYFRERCEQARHICNLYLQDPAAQTPALWAMEALFQALQRHISEINDPQKRASLAKSFFDDILPETLSLLVENRREPRRFIQELRRALDTDTCADELEFAVNYFLRSDEYSDEPYSRLKEMVARYEMNLGGGDA